MTHPVLLYWSPKGGTGTSTVAAATAIRLATEDRETTLVDLEGDQAQLLDMITEGDAPGLSAWAATPDALLGALDGIAADVAPGLRLVKPDGPGSDRPLIWRNGTARILAAIAHYASRGPVVVDAGRDPLGLRTELDNGRDRPVCVLRACYLALSRCQRIAGPYDRVVLVEEPGRALRLRDVAAAVGASSVERVAWDPRVARSVDAGTIVSMLPPPLARWELPV